MRMLHEFANHLSVRALCRSALHSVRIAVEVNVASDAAVRKISRQVQASSRTVLQWLHDMEAYLLKPGVDIPTMIKMLDSDNGEFREYLTATEEQLDRITGDTRGYIIIRGFL